MKSNVSSKDVEPVTTKTTFELLGETTTVVDPFLALQIEKVNNYLFVKEPTDSQTSGRIKVFFIEENYSLTELSTIETSNWENHIQCFCLKDNYLYFVYEYYYDNSWRYNLTICDISDKANPVFLSETVFPQRPHGIIAHGNFLYGFCYGDWFLKLIVYNISEGSKAKLVKTIDLYPDDEGMGHEYAFSSAKVFDKYLYITSEFGILFILNISVPESPSLLSSTQINASGYDIDLKDNYLFVASGLAGVKIYDVSNKSNPQLVSELNESSKCSMSLEINDNVLIVGDNIFGVHLFNISNIGSISEISSFNASDRVMDVIVENDTLYLAEMIAGIGIYNITNIANIVKIKQQMLISNSQQTCSSVRFRAFKQVHAEDNYADISDPWIGIGTLSEVGTGNESKAVPIPLDIALTSLFFYNDTNGDNKLTIAENPYLTNPNSVKEKIVEDDVYFIAEFWDVRIDINETEGVLYGSDKYPNGTRYYHCIYRVWNITMSPNSGVGLFFDAKVPDDKKIGNSGKANVTFHVWAFVPNATIENNTAITEVDVKIDIIIDLYDIDLGVDSDYFNAFIGFNARINYDLVSYPAMSKIEGQDLPSYSIRAADQIGVLKIMNNFSYTTANGTYNSSIYVSNHYSWENYFKTYEKVSRTILGINFLNISTNATRIQYDPEIILTLKNKYQPTQTEEQQPEEQPPSAGEEQPSPEETAEETGQGTGGQAGFNFPFRVTLIATIATVAVIIVTIVVKYVRKRGY